MEKENIEKLCEMGLATDEIVSDLNDDAADEIMTNAQNGIGYSLKTANILCRILRSTAKNIRKYNN